MEEINWKLIKIAALVTELTGQRLKPEDANEIIELLIGIRQDLKINKTAIKRPRRWFVARNIGTKEEITSNNQNEFARNYEISVGNISACLQGRRQTCKGWAFKWI